MRLVKPGEIDFARIVRPGDLVVWGQACAEPLVLTAGLARQRHRIGGFSAFVGISLGAVTDPDHADCIAFRSFCATGTNRRLIEAGRLDLLPLHYSRLPSWLEPRVDVLLLQLARCPDGSYSLSAACDYVAGLVGRARLVVAEINAQAPVTDARIAAERIDVAVEVDYPPAELARATPSQAERRVAAHVAALVEDGATLQFGLGSVPEAVAPLLEDRRRLGLHSGVLSDSAISLIRTGAVDNSAKALDAGVSVTGTLLGSRELLEFASGRHDISLRPIAQTHSLARIAAQPRFTAINSAIEVDLSGQANTETAAGRYVGTIGGALDFTRGAHASEGGLAILALPSVATRRDGTAVSRIVARLSGPAAIGRADAGIVVTEHGAADLRGLGLGERRDALLQIADPRFRDELAAASRGP